MKKHLFFLLVAAFAAACTVAEPVETIEVAAVDAPVFYATIDGAATRAYVDDQLRVLWDANDHVSIFNKYTYNLEYKFDGKTGDNAGTFTQVPHEFFVAGNELPLIYAVYPYKEGTSITNDGAIKFELPAVQSQLAGSFGVGDNTMVSVTEDNNLLFKNLCGYFGLKLYGKGSVQSITMKGNNDEPLAGVATITGAVGEAPTLVFAPAATKEITVNLPKPVTVGETQETVTLFWIVVPPTEFTKGVTFEVKGEDRTTTKVIDKALTIKRNTLTEGGFAIDIEHVNAKPMFCKFSDMIIRVGQSYTEKVWYGTPDKYADRDDIENADLVWTSDNEAVAAVVSGVIEGKAPGKANIKIADKENNYIIVPVEVLAAANKDYDYNYGVQLIDCRDASLAWNKKTDVYKLTDGYVADTKCMGATINGYKVAEVYFPKKVDVSMVKNPALYIRVYIDDVSKLTTASDGADQPYIEIRSTGEVWVPGTTSFPYVEEPKTMWRMTDIFTNWQGHSDKAKQTLVNGWNNIVLPVASAARAACDLSAITYFRFFQLPNQTYQPVEFRFDQIRVVDWTEFDTCDNFDQWFDGGTGNNRPCFRAAKNLDGHDVVFGSVNELITGPISNFRIKEWPGRVYALPADMDSSNARFTWWFWVDDADFFNKCDIKAELSSENVNDAHNWAWSSVPGTLNLKNGWNEITHDFSAALDQSGANSKRSDRKINYFRIVVTPQGDAQPGIHTYYIDDLRVSKK